MKPSTLKFYAATVCLFTAIACLITFSVSVWDSLERYVMEVKKSELYEFYGPFEPCEGCLEQYSQLAQPASSILVYQERAGTAPVAFKEPEIVEPQVHRISTGTRLVIALLAAFIFLTHWRLFRNLSAVAD